MAQTAPAAKGNALRDNVATPQVNGIDGTDTQDSFIQRVASIPIVSDTLTQVHSVIQANIFWAASSPSFAYLHAQSNSYASAAYAKAEGVANSVYSTVYPPLQKNLGPQLEAVDSYANKSLDYVQTKFPTAFEPTNEVIAKARKPADDAVAGVQARLGPYTGQIQSQLQQAQVNLHTVQEKLASVVASIPRSPKEVQNSAQELAQNLLNEVERIRETITASAKDLPANVQSHLHHLSEQLQHAANDIRAELSRTDIPLTTRAANVLTYSRQNTEKAIREALDRVSALLSKKSNEADASAKKVAATGQTKVNEAKKSAKSAASS